jgi:phospholipase C
MRSSGKLLLSLLFFGAALAPAQTLPHFDHIIIVVQENRTPDNLFGSGPSGTKCGIEDPFEPGVDIENGGYGYVPQPNGGTQLQLICNTSLPLSSWDANLHTAKIIDPDHNYNSPPPGQSIYGWVADFHNGHQDGFCHEYSNYAIYGSTCPSYSFVQKSDVQPYFDIATKYGFANYAFQTNEGPSFEAHQFLFTGTSAPVAPGKTNYLDFVAENPSKADNGCPQGFQNNFPQWVDPTGAEFKMNSYECYTHDSLVTDAADCNNSMRGTDHCDRGFSWAYYTPTAGIIWDAPVSVPEVCYGENDTTNSGQTCVQGSKNTGSTEWADHVFLPDQNGHSDAPIFDDLYNCGKPMPAITWVIPDFVWSDHPQDKGNASTKVYGPYWVGDIVNAVGGACGGKYWTTEPTAIVVVWDDWGGWFDHIAPIAALQENPHTGYTKCDPNSQWGCGYTSGFRVPLLVVSPWTGTPTQNGYTGYVSGACGAPPLPLCPNNVFPFEHDFGSILRFTELNFGMSLIYPRTNYYADANAPDGANGNTPLSDFFPLPLKQPRPFVSIPVPQQYDYTCFQHFAKCTGIPAYVPTGPDDDNAADQ